MTLLKDFVDRAAIEKLGRAIAAVHPEFSLAPFVQSATDGLPALELKERINHVAAVLERHLPADFPTAASIMARAVEQPGLDVWSAWPVNAWIEIAGRGQLPASISLIERVTGRSSSEAAVRPFIQSQPDAMRQVLERWIRSGDAHLRRLASEGSRPRLPWAPRLALAEDDPAWALFVLDALRDDPSEYVRRSVANHLNDISRLDSEAALAVAQRWRREGGRHIDRVLRHGLRTLIKRGDQRALELVGADTSTAIEVIDLALVTSRLTLGQALEFSCRVTIKEDRPANALLDYAVHFVKANGSTARKVFKLRTLHLAAGETASLSRRLPLVPISTRRYYPGRHLLEIQCNGIVGAAAEFQLDVPPGSQDVPPAVVMPAAAAGARMHQ